jgi:hypothetical protein
MMQEVTHLITRVGFFFLIAYGAGLLEMLFQKLMDDRRTGTIPKAPTAYLPLFQGIILPVLTTLLFRYPVGFNGNTSLSFSEEIHNHASKLFSLTFCLLFNFLLVILLKSFPGILFWSEGLFLNLILANLFFLIFNTLPFYPAIMSYPFLFFLRSSLLRKKGMESMENALLTYKHFSLFVFILIILLTELRVFYVKIVSFLNLLFSFPTLWTALITLFFSLLFALTALLYKRKVKRYQQEMHNALQNMLEEKEL